MGHSDGHHSSPFVQGTITGLSMVCGQFGSGRLGKEENANPQERDQDG
jgi:hypothetical protein